MIRVILTLVGLFQLWILPNLASASIKQGNLLKHAFLFENKGLPLDKDMITSPDFEKNFLPVDAQKHLSYGYTDSSFWVRVDLNNQTDTMEEFYIGTLRPDTYIFNLHERVNGKLITKRGGTSVPMNDREEFRRLHFFKISLLAKSSKRLYFEFQSKLDITLDLRLMSKNQLLKTQTELDLTHFAYFGIIFSLIIYSSFLFLALKNISFLIYGLFGLSMAASAFVYSGFIEYWSINFLGISSNQSARIFMALSPMFTILYSIIFLEISKLSKKIFLAASLLCLTTFAIVILMIFDKSTTASKFLIASQGLSTIFACILACYAVYRGSRAAIYYGIGTIIFIIAAIVWTLGNHGVLEKNYFVAFCPLFGSALEMLLTAIALSWKFKELQEMQFDKEITEAEKASLHTLVQVVCHDIANPLSVITLAKKMAMKHIEGNESLERIFERVDRASRSIESIISQVRRMQAIRSGKYQVQLESVDLAEIFTEVQFNLEQKAKGKNVDIVFEIVDLERQKIRVLAEPTSLVHDVLNNFVSNAIKFSHEGSQVTIRASKKNQWVIIEVEDQGIGIPENIMANIFSQHKATTRPGTQNETGTGFGMPLAKYFIEQYGGTVQIKSLESQNSPSNHGTTIITQLRSS